MDEVAVVEPDVFRCIGGLRAVRRIKPDPVPEAAIRKVLWAATQAPSGANKQPWRFVVVRDPGRKRELGRLYAESFYRGSQDFLDALPANLPDEVRAAAQRTYASAKYLADHMHEAPAIIIVCQLPLGHEDGEIGGSSVYPAVQNMLLAARALGLAAAITTIVSENAAAVRSLLGVPDEAALAAQIAIGWPMGRFGTPRRRPVEAVTFVDAWGEKLPPPTNGD